MKRRWPALRVVGSAVVLLAFHHSLAQIPGVPPIQAGLRVSFYASSASIRGSYQQAVLKPNCNPAIEDCWVDPDTGQTITQEEIPSVGGQGYTNLDILYMDAQTCVFRVTSYVLDVMTGSVSTSSAGGDVTTGGACSDYWMDPATLNGMEVQLTSEFRVLKGPYTLGDTTFDAVTISSTGGGGSHGSSYDAASGFLIAASSRVQGSAVPTITPDNTIAPGSGSTMLTYTQILGARLMQGLGSFEALPAHVLNTNRLVYDCSYTSAMPGAGAISTPCQLEIRLGQRTDAWASVNSVLHMADQLSGTYSMPETNNVIVASGHGGYYAAPSLLSGLEQGAHLDTDPITGVRTTVVHKDASVVAIQEESNAERKTFVYDLASGWLVQLVTEQLLLNSTYTTRFDLVSVE